MTLEVHHRVSSVSTSSRFKVLFDSGFKVLFDGVVIVSDREGKIVYTSFYLLPKELDSTGGFEKRTQIVMFRPIRMDHTNCLQVAIKTHSFKFVHGKLFVSR